MGESVRTRGSQPAWLARAACVARFCLLAAAAALFAACTPAKPPPPERIFLFVVDTLRRDHLSTYGSELATPNMDSIGAEGVRYDNAVASFHQTTMSMSALFTGHTPSIERANNPARSVGWTSRAWCGLSRYLEDDEDTCVPAKMTTLAEQFQQAGYWTAGVTSNKFLYDPSGFRQGFDYWREVGKGNLPLEDGSWADERQVRDFRFVNPLILDALDERQSDRFFFYAHWVDVHDHPFKKYNYPRGVVKFDYHFGKLLDEIRSRGLFEDALIIFTSDHGESLGEPTAVRVEIGHRGNPSFEAQLQIPLLASPSLGIEADRLVRLQDLGGLILRAAGIEPQETDNLLEDDELFLTEAVYQTYRRGRFKSTRNRETGVTTLFDLVEDPGETRDFSAEHPEVVKTHGARVVELAAKLATDKPMPERLTLSDLAALYALGYIDSPELEPADSQEDGAAEDEAPAEGDLE